MLLSWLGVLFYSLLPLFELLFVQEVGYFFFVESFAECDDVL